MSREKKPRNQNLTIPNALSCMRILLVPFFAWCFLRGSLTWAAALLVLSGLTDMFDGLIARKCNQITELGKILDPFADKLTQGVVALCLAIRFPMIGPLLGLFIAKELLMLCCALVLLKKRRRPGGAKWYGKVATVMFYVSVSVIVVMDGLHLAATPQAFYTVSFVLLTLTALMMLYAAFRYSQVFFTLLHSTDEENHLDLPDEIHAKKGGPPPAA
ncbi:CDP-alcohol phosphatidyltransferase family protein [Oscillospiraceae bacterium 21-37]|uniref:CDP-alcohol phosphatidyltransferase family protein n=1 Tax=Acutalibacter sp. JLR.KK004 TaxID=3112622 RepID=UPI002FF3B1EE